MKQQPEIFVPGAEALGENEIWLTCIGSSNLIVRRAQAAPVGFTSWTMATSLFSRRRRHGSEVVESADPPAEFDKLFLTHLHLDHAGDYNVLFGAMGWARNTRLQF